MVKGGGGFERIIWKLVVKLEIMVKVKLMYLFIFIKIGKGREWSN
jgi:hypothetical protein